MLLLPLLILWARTPMHFGTPLRYSTLAAIFLISLVAPTYSLGLAGEGYGVSAPLVPVNEAEKDAKAGSENMNSGLRHLREGTLVDGIAGRFALIGRRWAFIPNRPADNSLAATPADSEGQSAGAGSFKNSTSAVFETRSSSGQSISVTTSTNRARSSLLKEYAPANSINSGADLPQLHVVENLMLQRVVEAIRADATDVHWVISGEIKEYFDDNMVLLRTAQRAIVALPQ